MKKLKTYEAYSKLNIENNFNSYIINYINKLLPENTNVNLISDNHNSVEAYIYGDGLDLFDIHKKHLEYKFINFFEDDGVKYFSSIEDLEDYIEKFMNYFYYKYINELVNKKYLFNLKTIPVFNLKKYNYVILKILDNNINYSNQLKDIIQYLDIDILHKYKYKYKYIIDAINFDLI